MKAPQYLLSKVVTRANYNIGRVLKEAGLCKFPTFSETLFQKEFEKKLCFFRSGQTGLNDV